MADRFHIVSIDERNITGYPHIVCFINPKHESFHIKIDWLKKRYSEGLRLKLLYPEGEKYALRFNDWKTELSRYKGLHIVYSNQCPWVGRFVKDIRNKKEYRHLNLEFTELKTAKEAQKAPSPYATFNLIHNGKLLADHYISETRFKNILKKEKII